MCDLDALLAKAQDVAVLGPDDVLVIQLDSVMGRQEFDEVTALLEAGPLAGRVLLVAGAKKLLVARAAGTERADV